MEDYLLLLAEQAGACAICGEEPTDQPLAVDHHHNTGAVRGLLCTGCNTGIGSLKDNPEVLRLAATYLEKEVRLWTPPA